MAEGIKVGKFNRGQSMDLSSSLTKLEEIWRKNELHAHLTIRAQQSDIAAQRLAIQYAAHCWLHAIPAAGHLDNLLIPGELIHIQNSYYFSLYCLYFFRSENYFD